MLSNNVKAALLIMAGMSLIASNDVIIKLGSEDLGIGQLLFIRGLMATIVFAFIIKLSGRPLWPQTSLSKLNGYRALFECCATLCFITGLSLLPISTVSTLAWTSPIFLTISASIFLGERISWVRWVAVLVGFAGVLMITNPSASEFSWAMVLPLAAAVFVCGRDIITRQLDPGLHSMHVTFATLGLVTLVGGLIALFDWRPVEFMQIAWLVVSAVLLSLGFLSQVSGMRLGELSFIAPFSFTGILVSIIYGYLVWEEFPATLTLAGMAMIIGSGIYILSYHRFHRRQVRVAGTRDYF